VYLTEVGLTRLEALQAATPSPAQFFNATDSLGTVAPGKSADLVLLDANPLEDLKNLRSIRAVVANGRYFDRTTLDTLNPDGLTAPADFMKYYRWHSMAGTAQQARVAARLLLGVADAPGRPEGNNDSEFAKVRSP
jgi:adenine deaminase